MCGDLEEEDNRAEDQLYARFRLHARELLRGHTPQGATPTANDLNAYMDRLFGDALSRCVRDGEEADGSAYELLRAQPLVLARLAGFLAAHVSLQEDPLRKVMEAMMHGYAEAEHIEPDHHGHDHGHGHSHRTDHPPLEGEGRLRSRGGGVTPFPLDPEPVSPPPVRLRGRAPQGR